MKLIFELISESVNVIILEKVEHIEFIKGKQKPHTYTQSHIVQKIKRKVTCKSFELLGSIKLKENQCFNVAIKHISLYLRDESFAVP